MTAKKSKIATNEYCLCGCGNKLKGVGTSGYYVGHYPRTPETREKISKSKTGKPGTKHTEEEKQRRRERIMGDKNPMFGRRWSEEEKKQIGVRSSATNRTQAWNDAISQSKKGKIPYSGAIENISKYRIKAGDKLTDETKIKISRSLKGRKMSQSFCEGLGKRTRENWLNGKFKSKPFYSNQKIGKRNDLGNYRFRSTWEANFARLMNYWGIGWEYEPKRFDCGDAGTYAPDFRLEIGVWVEVKGYDYPAGRKKINAFMEMYPSEKLIEIRGDYFKYIDLGVKRSIPEWE